MISKNIQVRFLALGDSYTIGESVDEAQRWPAQLVVALKERGYACDEPVIVAVTGWRTDDLKRTLEKARPSPEYTLVSLLIGVNNQYQKKSVGDYEKDFAALVDMAAAYAGGNARKVMVLSIPDYGFTPFGRDKQAEISSEIDAFNAVNKSVAHAKGAPYIDITDISRRGLHDPELIADDGLHPSGKMYALWVRRILDALGC